jgi:hypothetical protein
MLCLRRKHKMERPLSARILEMLNGTLKMLEIYFNIQLCGNIFIVLEICLFKVK